MAHHWADRAKLRRDHDYLVSLRETLLAALADALNDYHGIERPLRYWRIILDIWLVTYVAVMFERWEAVRCAFEKYGELDTIALDWSHDHQPPRDADDFIQTAAFSSPWNHRLFLRVIGFEYSGRCRIRAASGERFGTAAPATPGGAGASGSLFGLAARLDGVAGRVFEHNKATFVASYFPFRALVRLNVALGQVPRFYWKEFFRAPPVFAGPLAADEKTRGERLVVNWKPVGRFEEFLHASLPTDVPSAWVEGFGGLLDHARRLNMSTRVILSANAHWTNEPFKVWAAEQVARGTKFVAMEHGGGIPPLFDTMSFEEKISDQRVVWSIPYAANHVQLPPSKLVTRRFRTSGRHCSVIGSETPLFPYRATAAPISGQALESCSMICDMYAASSPEVQKAFRVKPYPDLGWNTAQRFRDRLGADKVYDEPSYYRVLEQSRVVVCTYPNTTLSEALAAGLPTILVYPAHLWETIPEMAHLLETLREAGMIFDAAAPAAEALSALWADPEGVWNRPAMVHAKQEYFRHCLDLDPRWLERWTGFVRRMAA